VLRFAGALFTAMGVTDGVLTFTSGDEPAKSAIKMLESMGLADRWQPAGPAQVNIRNSGPLGAEVSINVKLPAGTTVAAAARHLAALGIAVA
jgi:hypothetical protein